ncbi:MAG: DUF4921 family protein [Methanohalobium sp.]|uniref:galactose-1-phosphate uridylyltransferase n=1 Tax=Methanohalobium sp. TaxID=2837493 RepID=UPI00397A2EF9
MSEIRKHYFLDEYCIIATERGKRPSDFASANVSGKQTEPHGHDCVFCAGNEAKTPPASAVYRSGEILKDTENERVTGWWVRCIPNLYPALSPNPGSLEQDDFNWQKFEGYGYHEVIVETPVHNKKVSESSDDEIKLLMQVYRDRTTHYESKKGIVYTSLFKNWGEKSGASINHTHSQLIALPFMPPNLKIEQNTIDNATRCPYCDIVEKEKNSRRLLYNNEDIIVIAPFFSKTPFELWILPKNHFNHMINFTDDLLSQLGDALRFAVYSLEKTLGSISYNYMFNQILADSSYHFNLKIQPVLSTIGGFEKNTDIYINTIPPEDAVNYFKNSI